VIENAKKWGEIFPGTLSAILQRREQNDVQKLQLIQ
jgi:hypothetical protein